MKRSRLRRVLPTTAIALAAIAGWYWLAPPGIGGSTTYVATNGVSMQPRFHTGDLALVRPSAAYHVGEIVAYHSSLLHVVVLHRIVALDGARYVFKGDNNSFLDPIRPLRSDLIGALWLRIPHGGVVLRVLHAPVMVGVILAIVGLLTVWGVFETRQRRRRRRGDGPPAPQKRRGRAPVRPLTAARAKGDGTSIDPRPILIVTASVAGVLFLAGLIGFANPASRLVKRPIAYTQSTSFSYSAAVAPGPVYPDGMVHTGQPIFLHLVRRVQVSANYRLLTAFDHRVGGTAQLVLVITGPTGWSRTFALTRPMAFGGPHMRAQATLDLGSVQGLLSQVQNLTGVPAEGAYSLAVQLRVQADGTLGGRRLQAHFQPALSFGLQAFQLQPAGATPPAGGPNGGLLQTQRASIPATAVVDNQISVFGADIAVAPLRWLSVLGFLLAASASAFLFVLVKLREPFAESERIRARYGHLIVPVVATPEALEYVPYDVTDIEALVRLAEAGDRLILHHRDPVGDTYLVSDDTTVYRYRPGPARVVWGEWSTPQPNGGGHHPVSPENGHPAPASGPPAPAGPAAPTPAAAQRAPSPAAAQPAPSPPAAQPAPSAAAAQPAPSAAAAQSVATPPVGVPLSAFEAASRKRRSTAQLGLAALGLMVGLRRPARR